MATPLVLYPVFLDKTLFSPTTDRAGPLPTGPFYYPTRSHPLNFAWLYHGVALLGIPGLDLLCPFTLWGSINEYSRILTPRGAKRATIPTPAPIDTVPELWLRGRLLGGHSYVSHMSTPLVLYSGFLHKTKFPRILTHGPGTHRALLQFAHGPVLELCLALPWRAAAVGTRHRSPHTRTRSRIWILTSVLATSESELRLAEYSLRPPPPPHTHTHSARPPHSPEIL